MNVLDIDSVYHALAYAKTNTNYEDKEMEKLLANAVEKRVTSLKERHLGTFLFYMGRL